VSITFTFVSVGFSISCPVRSTASSNRSTSFKIFWPWLETQMLISIFLVIMSLNYLMPSCIIRK